MISVDEALERILKSVRPLGSERVALAESAGRVLAEDLRAKLFNPAFNVSAMDGYAVRAEDVRPGVTLRMVGASQAGAGFDGTVGPGQCTRIFTGAPVPAGADAVIMQEETRAEGNAITFDCDVAPGRSVRFRGEDFAQGDVLIATGAVLDPRKIALAAAGNVARLSISARPRVALLATGDELVAPGGVVGPDQIVASNSVGLAAFFSGHGAQVRDLGIVADDRDVLGDALARALADGPDILLTTGGASVGEHDFVQDMLKANGVDIDFWRIAMRPGKPLMFGRKGKTVVFGLPGNPVSALVTARIFVLPALQKMMGGALPAPLYLPLADALPPNGPRRHFMRGRLVSDAEQGTRVAPIRQTDSGHLSSLAAADVLIVQDENCPGKVRGDLVAAHLF
ncbi:gephyrin-like molybdotransferase Glp [Pelagibacterium halotolerans]|uniref:Molybdopterin molybdenumtransferase n=1 Tax=Pelagibacterium halotolerans (strain DSM 22347 / JCM 15775 / CGMCC 1.7692 / B2) TaxID=1082931 RepID=G4R8X4_PELHB|nr:gephyrin-like molybdotransferase Glp [Pelagibacterium halotolerans]AEQ51391.1 molybdopterin biosynthesis protein MoeA [Pelagibacterium halotolerans B2]QJR18766.1 molybdopterin molybdotransferase MoeA [Pelagibacterium halotolerans]SEA12158.1 molybdopterin molybdochelatase [Pelagibacterium halotolerans]